MASARKKTKLCIALPGGGTLGAYSWGVLDALMEDGRFDVPAISAVGSGAVNALLLAGEWQHGGRHSVRKRLTDFWREVAFSSSAEYPVFPAARWNDERFAQVLGPFDADVVAPMATLRDRAERHIDFDASNFSPVRVMLGATNISSTNIAIFDTRMMRVWTDHLLASAATPFACAPVSIDGEFYWGDGFGGDPPLFPLVEAAASDILLVRQEGSAAYRPNCAPEFLERMSYLSQRMALNSELRFINFISNLVSRRKRAELRYRQVRMHVIDGGASIAGVVGAGGTNHARSDPDFIQNLFLLGRDEALNWLAEHGKSVGVKSTM